MKSNDGLKYAIFHFIVRSNKNSFLSQFTFSFYQIQDVDDPVPDNNQTGSSTSLSALDAQQKPSLCRNLEPVADMVFIKLAGHLW